MACNCGQSVKRAPVKQVTKRTVVKPVIRNNGGTRRTIKLPAR